MSKHQHCRALVYKLSMCWPRAVSSNSSFASLIFPASWVGGEQEDVGLCFCGGARSQSSVLRWCAGLASVWLRLCCAVELSWGLEQGKTLKLTWVTTLSPTSCCTVNHKAAMAVWNGGPSKGIGSAFHWSGLEGEPPP